VASGLRASVAAIGDTYTRPQCEERTMALERSPNDPDSLTGQCDHCEWSTVTTAYPELVRQYQDHLRETHPRVWLRG
jgi:hypothetical protein